MDDVSDEVSMINLNSGVIDNQPAVANDSAYSVNSEEGDNSNIATYLNSETQELKLDLDSYDFTTQNICSNYYLEKEIISSSHSDPKQLFISHFNIRSLNKNFDQFSIFINELRFENAVIGLSETWLKDSSPSSLFTIDGYKLITNNRKNKKGGGVGFYVSEDLNYELLQNCSFMLESLECIFIEIKLPKKGNIIVGEIYRPPNSNPAQFIEMLDGLLSDNFFHNKSCFIMGDFNLDLLNCSNNPPSQDFLSLMLSKSFLPLTRKPTRISDNSATLIDNIFFNSLYSDVSSGIIVSDLTDHLPIFALLSNMSTTKTQPTNFGFRNMSESNINRLRERLRSVNWSTVYNQRDANLSFDTFLNILSSNYNATIPLSKPNRSYYKKIPRQPWITKSLLRSINKKNKLYYKYRKAPNTLNKSRYTCYRNILSTSLRLAKKSYFSEQFDKCKFDVKSTWKVINEALKSKTSSDLPKHILKDGLQIDNSADIAQAFNEYFVNLGPDLASKIPNSQTSFHSFLKERNSESLFFVPIVEEEIKEIVNSLNNKKSSGYDGITNFLLKSIIDEIITPLTHILNQSLTYGKVPLKLKIAKVVPIYKKGPKESLNNYRPISLLTSISKILERLVYKRTLRFLISCKILSNSQFGFRQKHSTTHALLSFIDKVAHAIDDMSHTIGVFLDFSKAFDTIDHEILLYKLSHYGIRGQALAWFRDYLTARKQFVSINGQDSPMKLISCGVPQGSLLGPLLFILYINDLQNSSQILSFICFADDTNLFLSHRNPNTLLNLMNNELQLVQSWIHANKLSLNIEKTNYMLFSNSLDTLPSHVQINGINILQVDSTKFLGLHIDNDLSWRSHTNYLNKILSRNVGILYKLKNYFSGPILLNIYLTLISPYLNYGILAWGNTFKMLLDSLFLIQKRAIRIVNNAEYLAHTNDLFRRSGILKVTDLFNYNVGIFMYKFSSNNLPDIFLEMFIRNNSVHNYPTRQRDAYHLPRTRTIFAKKTIMYTGPKYWNDLPSEVTSSLTLSSFKYKLKQLILNSYVDNTD